MTWLLDGAHTTESLRSCGEWAWAEAKPNVLVFNCSGGRQSESLLGALLDAGPSRRASAAKTSARLSTLSSSAQTSHIPTATSRAVSSLWYCHKEHS